MSKDMEELFIDELHDLLSCEEQIIQALPKVIDATESKDLKDALTSHLKETKEQVRRLEKIFKLLKIKKEEKFCKGTRGLIQECEEAIKELPKSPVRDAAIISKTQRIEHYEISAYGTVRTFAEELGLNEAAGLLQETLDEEAHADKKLTKIAEGGLFRAGINHKANMPIKKAMAAKKTSVMRPRKAAATNRPARTAQKSPAKKVSKPMSRAKSTSGKR